MNNLSDLAQDEDDLAKAIDDIYDDYAERLPNSVPKSRAKRKAS